MFRVGIDWGEKGLAQIQKQLDSFIDNYTSKMKLQVEMKDMEKFVSQLKRLGSGEYMQPLLNKIEQVQNRMDAMGIYGQASVERLKTAYNEATAAVERYNAQTRAMSKDRGEGYAERRQSNDIYKGLVENQRVAAENLRMAQEALARQNSQAATSNDAVAQSEKNAATAAKEQAEAIRQLGTELSKAFGQTVKVTGFEQLTADVQALVQNIQKLAQTQQQTQTSGGMLDPQKITTLSEALDKITGQVNLLRSAFEKLGKDDALKGLTTTITGLRETLAGLNNAFKFVGNTEEMAAYEAKVRSLQEQIVSLENKANGLAETTKKLNTEFKTIGEAKGSEATLNKNLDKVQAALEKITQSIAKVGPSYDIFKAAGLSDEGLERKYELLLKLREALQAALQNKDLMAKPGALSAITIMDGDRSLMALGEMTKELRSAKGASQLAADFQKAAAAAEQMRAGTQQTNQTVVTLTASEQNLAAALARGSGEMRNQSQVLSDLKMMAMQYISVWGAQSFLNNIIETGGQLEQQRMSLGAILGDMNKATTLFNQIKQLAVKSPFGVVQLDQMSKQLAAYSFEYEELFEWTKRLADISAATGTEVSRLALALGHVRSEGALSGYTLRQFSMANVPVLRMLSENLGISAKEVRERVRGKEISAEDVQDILRQLTDDGGMFANAQETMSEALNAKFKNLRDAFDIMYGEIAEGGVGDALKSLASTLTEGAKHWERLGKDIIEVAAAFGIGRAAMVLYNRALGSNTISALRNISVAQQQENAHYRLMRAADAMTEAEYRAMIFNGRYSASGIKVALLENKITIAELQRAVALGKVNKQVAMEAVGAAGLNTALISNIRVLKGWRLAWFLAAEGIRSLGVAIKGLMATMWPMLALTAVFELWNRRSEQKDLAADTANAMSGSGRGKEAYDLNSMLGDSSKLSDEAMQENIKTMEDALVAADAYTDALREQVGQIDDTAEKYDLLKKKVGEVAAQHEQSKDSEAKLLEEAWNAGGGWFSDNMAADAKDHTDAVANFSKQLTISSKQIRETLQQWMQSRGLWDDAYANMTGKQLYESLSSQNQQSFLSWGWSAQGLDTETTAAIRNIAIARNKVMKALNEMHGEQGEEFASKIKAIYEEAFAVDLDKASDEQKIAFDKWLKDTIGRAENLAEDTKNALRNIVIDFTIKLVPKYEVAQLTPEQQIKETFAGNTWLGDLFNKETKGNKAQRSPETAKNFQKLLGDITLSNIDNASKNINKQLDEREETIKNLKNTIDKGGLSKGDKDKLQKRLDKAEEEQTWLEDALSHVGGTRQRKGSKSGSGRSGSTEDKNAKRLRERVRILKEAGDSYQYWRKAVGRGGAFSHVNDEFGVLLGEQGFSVDNADKLRETLENLRKEYEKFPKTKAMLEALKEIDKEMAQLERKDFEEAVTSMTSQLSFDIEELTRKWEIFNSVLSSTGDSALARRLTGIAPGATPADLKRANLSSFAGADIDYNAVLGMSDEQIDRYVETLGVSETKIKAIQNGLKDWKKSQQDIVKSDIEQYARWLASLVDLESIRNRNQEEYNETLRSTNRLLSEGLITQEEAARRNNAALVTKNNKDWQATSMYTNLYNNSLGMARTEFAMAFEYEMQMLKSQLKTGAITLQDYADKVEKLNQIAREFSQQGFLGIRGGVGAFLSGGSSGLSQYYRNRAATERTNGNDENADKYTKRADNLDKQQKAGEELIKTFQDLSTAADLLGNMFDALGMQGAANAFGDAAGILGGIASGASSLSALGPYGMAAGAAIGAVTSIAQLHDKHQQRLIDALQDDVDALEANTSMLQNVRDRALGYDSAPLRERLRAQYYAPNKQTSLGFWYRSAAQRAMSDYYGVGSGRDSYAQELANLQQQRQDYMDMYDAENGKKKKSQDSLREYQEKIAELDDQIMNFSEDLANDLWGMDLKSWAGELSDALTTAWENGEDAAKAFDDTVADIMRDVVKNILNLSLVEPMFEQLRQQLFGENGAIKWITDANGNKMGIDWQASQGNVAAVINDALGEGGWMRNTLVSDYPAMMDAMQAAMPDIDLRGTSSSTASNSIKGITEATADLLAAYLNAIRLDVSVNRALISEYFPSFLSTMTNGNQSLANIERHTSEIARLSASIDQSTAETYSLIRGLKNKAWSVPIG